MPLDRHLAKAVGTGVRATVDTLNAPSRACATARACSSAATFAGGSLAGAYKPIQLLNRKRSRLLLRGRASRRSDGRALPLPIRARGRPGVPAGLRRHRRVPRARRSRTPARTPGRRRRPGRVYGVRSPRRRWVHRRIGVLRQRGACRSSPGRRLRRSPRRTSSRWSGAAWARQPAAPNCSSRRRLARRAPWSSSGVGAAVSERTMCMDLEAKAFFGRSDPACHPRLVGPSISRQLDVVTDRQESGFARGPRKEAWILSVR